jgi:NDP-sugar pyrophosphorylase family protein
MKAVILAGGRGTRLAPYTTVLPKPLMPVGDRPILEIVVRQLAQHGFTNLVLAVGHLAELLEAYFGDGERFGVDISYSREKEPLGTAGPLGIVEGLTERFLVMNGDVLAGIDFTAMLAHHDSAGALATVAVHPRKVRIDLGVVEFDEEGLLTEYVEKPELEYKVSMGVYILEPRVLEFVEPNVRLDLPDLMKRLAAAGEKVSCYLYDGYWMDIGRPDDYERAVADFPERADELLPGEGKA